MKDESLVGHWKLAGDVNDSSGHGNHGENHGVDLSAPGHDGRPNTAGAFDGRGGFVLV
ncbi:MAG: hypothetical protein IH956_09660, partial [Chloroflexi bacterium]|nr:hypothetical protein [Chloroflexota bacterium]